MDRISTSAHFRIDPYDLRFAGAFNVPVNGPEANVYIDPRLLRTSRVKEFNGAMDDVALYYADVLKDIEDAHRSSGKIRAAYRDEAIKKLHFPELRGLRIGYGKGGDGKAFGPKRARTLYGLADRFVRDDFEDPILFEIFTIVEKGVGADLISDMVASISQRRIYEFSRRIGNEFDLPMQEYFVGDTRYEVTWNPVRNEPLLFPPCDGVADIPAFGRSAAYDSFTFNHPTLREAFSKFLKKHAGAGARQFLRKNPNLVKETILAYKDFEPLRHDAFVGKAGIALAAKEMYEGIKDRFVSPIQPPTSAKELHSCILDICARFKEDVEAGRCRRHLHSNNGPRSEADVQDMFRLMASTFCKDRDIKLSPESDAGVGPADFQFDRGANAVAIMELKLSSNEALLAGYEHQTPRYKAANGAHSTVYYVVDFDDERERLEALVKAHDARSGDHARPFLFVVDGRATPSASKIRKHETPLPRPETQPTPNFEQLAAA